MEKGFSKKKIIILSVAILIAVLSLSISFFGIMKSNNEEKSLSVKGATQESSEEYDYKVGDKTYTIKYTKDGDKESWKYNGASIISSNPGFGDRQGFSVFTIRSELGLAIFSQITLGTDEVPYVSLANDLDMTNWEMNYIGNSESYFRGIFDGDGHTISGLKHGLFCYTSSYILTDRWGTTSTHKETEIKNLHITNSEVNNFLLVEKVLGGTKISSIYVDETCTINYSPIENYEVCGAGALVSVISTNAKLEVSSCAVRAKIVCANKWVNVSTLSNDPIRKIYTGCLQTNYFIACGGYVGLNLGEVSFFDCYFDGEFDIEADVPTTDEQSTMYGKWDFIYIGGLTSSGRNTSYKPTGTVSSVKNCYIKITIIKLKIHLRNSRTNDSLSDGGRLINILAPGVNPKNQPEFSGNYYYLYSDEGNPVQIYTIENGFDKLKYFAMEDIFTVHGTQKDLFNT